MTDCTNTSHMNSISFFVPGRPRPTARPRVLRSGRTYLPKATRDAQNAVAEAALQATGGKRPLYPTQPLAVGIQAVFDYPKSTPQKKRLPGWSFMPQRPDVDNLAKTVLDGCNEIVWADDAQIVELTVTKWRGNDAGFYVEINEAS